MEPMVVGLDHVQIAMPRGGEEQARRFYGETLGIPERPKPAALAAHGGVWFESGAVKIHLGVDQEFRPARKAHPALVVRNLPALLNRLRASGVDVGEHALGDRDRVNITDPFGNRLELIAAD